MCAATEPRKPDAAAVDHLLRVLWTLPLTTSERVRVPVCLSAPPHETNHLHSSGRMHLSLVVCQWVQLYLSHGQKLKREEEEEKEEDEEEYHGNQGHV